MSRLAALALSACFSPVHDANEPCPLVRGGAPDGGAVPIQNDDPEKYRQTFGETEPPYFCTRAR
ncbi:MAG: hypothetical protein JNK82_12530 [Myxococcaceae bacterium]|nr:hypothetical protein [Myxococcaceae bacterium]